ncbi:DsbA family protein [Streptomyces carpaticus]|uniref:thioredoxin domain-containing protein n=1 Tax=Streptomyces TaxID=1883 RepID=UPI00220B82A7|nr:DsbA family protein [Streptomyces carpaticus]
MSKRNSQEAKREARERLKAEREKQAKRDKIRRQLTVGGSALAILAIAGGIGFAIANNTGGGSDSTDWSAARDILDNGAPSGDDADGEDSADGVNYPTEAPANTGGDDGLTVQVGDPDAANTVTLYEDPRCPICATFEQAMGETIKQGIEDGSYKVDFVFGTFLDNNFPGNGSKNAVAALGAALNVSPEAFLEYHEAMFSEEWHPAENKDGFTDEYLIEIGDSIPELKDNQEFQDAITNSTYATWALQMSDKFDASGVGGTPSMAINGQKLEQVPYSPTDLDAALAAYPAE